MFVDPGARLVLYCCPNRPRSARLGLAAKKVYMQIYSKAATPEEALTPHGIVRVGSVVLSDWAGVGRLLKVAISAIRQHPPEMKIGHLRRSLGGFDVSTRKPLSNGHGEDVPYERYSLGPDTFCSSVK